MKLDLIIWDHKCNVEKYKRVRQREQEQKWHKWQKSAQKQLKKATLIKGQHNMEAQI